MIKEITLPEIAENVEDGTVITVMVREGDTISADQNVVEVETDKAAVEVPASVGGTVTEILVQEGDDVTIGQTLMKVETEEDAAEQPAQQEDSQPEPSEQREDRPAAEVPASPATRRFARELGVSITEVSGSGPSGRISTDDVKTHARAMLSERTEPRAGESGGAGARARREQMTRVRRLTAERTAESWRSIPHVTHFEEAELTELNRFIDQHQGRVSKNGGKLTVTAVLTKLVSHALLAFPRFNAELDAEADEIVYHGEIGIGIAVDTDRGLLVPVLRDPDRKSVTAIALELGELAAKARDGSLGPEQMQGGTFSISNLGGIGGVGFTPVIVAPQVAILAVARAQTRPVYDGHGFSAREMLPLGISYDHRVIDGADGARFMRWLKTAIEDPFAALMEGGR